MKDVITRDILALSIQHYITIALPVNLMLRKEGVTIGDPHSMHYFAFQLQTSEVQQHNPE